MKKPVKCSCAKIVRDSNVLVLLSVSRDGEGSSNAAPSSELNSMFDGPADLAIQRKTEANQ